MLPAYAGSSDRMWNNTEIPLAYFITVRCYGTWLHGDEKGSVDRFNNVYGEPYAKADGGRKEFNANLMIGKPVKLDARRRKTVDDAVLEVCEKRKWQLLALNVRTNHFHVVVSASANADSTLNAFKAYATRKMREKNCWKNDYSPWVNKGSKRKLWNDRHIELAVDYVINGQGKDLPKFD
jgi:REP element-mobilizing transposase RayT